MCFGCFCLKKDEILVKFSLMFFLVLASCGVYTFGGSSLPTHLKTIEIPLFENHALVQGVAEDVTDAITRSMAKEKLTVVANNGDAILSGVILSYNKKAYDYSGSEQDVDVNSYSVNIVTKVKFYDNIAKKSIYEGTLRAQGVYDFKTETEEIGRTRAVKDLVNKIMINSLQGW